MAVVGYSNPATLAADSSCPESGAKQSVGLIRCLRYFKLARIQVIIVQVLKLHLHCNIDVLGGKELLSAQRKDEDSFLRRKMDFFPLACCVGG